MASVMFSTLSRVSIKTNETNDSTQDVFDNFQDMYTVTILDDAPIQAKAAAQQMRLQFSNVGTTTINVIDAPNLLATLQLQ